MNARVYDPDIGRFLSPDPTVPGAHNPQAFNRYAYAFNSPLNLVDPDGFEPTAGPHGYNDGSKDQPSSSGPSTGSNGTPAAGNAIGANQPQNKNTTSLIGFISDKFAYISTTAKATFAALLDQSAKNHLDADSQLVGAFFSAWANSNRQSAGASPEQLATGQTIAMDIAVVASVMTRKGSVKGPATITNQVKAVTPGQQGSYAGLKSQKAAHGQTEALHMDHQPSLAAQIAARQEQLGRTLTKSEISQLRSSTPAVASPAAVHQQTSPTFGGRNTSTQIANDAQNLGAAAARDKAIFDNAMRNR